ncbi:glycosyltransferase, partial [Candidatus Peregrinibacteria bacterium]|nr:glycosyltransferase [Candidatus Peregrinibacteria bacterium]
HGVYDDRIYWKEAVSLKKGGYEVHVVAMGNKNESGITDEGIFYTQLERKTYFKSRVINKLYKILFKKEFHHEILKAAKEIGAGVYHFHDVNLNKIVKGLKQITPVPIIINDVHEPYPENIIDYKSYSKKIGVLNQFISSRIKLLEKKASRYYDHIIATEEVVASKFVSYTCVNRVSVLYNYFMDDQFETDGTDEKRYDGIYTGSITKIRGAIEIIEAIGIVKRQIPTIKFLFLGKIHCDSLKDEMNYKINRLGLETNIFIVDSVPFNEVGHYYLKSKVGFGIFKDNKTHRTILPIKTFEYMAFGLPIICSYFSVMGKYVTKHNCGILVDPDKPEQIATGFIQLLTNNQAVSEMGSLGRNAVNNFYTWNSEEKKLLKIYSKLLEDGPVKA